MNIILLQTMFLLFIFNQIINYSSKTLKEAKRMNNIIIDMLNLSSIEQNYQKKQDIVKVDKALIEILDSLEDRIKARNISVITNIAKCDVRSDNRPVFISGSP